MAKLDKEECTKFHNACPMRDLLTRFADKWSILIIVTLNEAPKSMLRFSELKKSIDGISQRMLTATLKNLERDGLLLRQLYPEVPPRVEYTLTALGKSVLVPMKGLVEWLEAKGAEVEGHREKYDAKIKLLKAG